MSYKDIRFLRVVVTLLLFTLSLGLWSQPAMARPAAQTGEISVADTYSFGDMGLLFSSLASPHDRQTLSFSLPAGLMLAEGSSLTLDLRTEILNSATAELPEDPTTDLGGLISISFNGILLERLPVTAEPQRTITLDIPAEALAGLPEAGRYTLTLELNTETDCAFGDSLQVSVGDGSSFVLPTTDAPVTPSLAALPAPLYQNSFLPESAILVVPDAPTESEMRSVMLVAASLGRLTGSNLGLSVRRVSDITEAEYASNHLVMVGMPSNLPLLSEVTLPVEIEDGVFVSDDLRTDDGVVQVALSPWDESRLVLVVGGNSEAGLVKAAEALVMNQLLLDQTKPDWSLIADINPVSNDIPPVERTFADLGYPTTRRAGSIGTTNLTYNFSLPAGQMPGEEASVELAFTHAAVINYAESSVTVLLNGNEIGGIRLSEDTVELTRESFLLPRDLLRVGRNDLQLRVTLAPPEGCIDDNALDAWLSVWANSRVIVPLEPSTGQQLRSASLDSYPQILVNNPTLADTAFVFNAEDTASWEVAAQIISNLATLTTDFPVDLAVAFDEAVSEELRQSRNLVLVGQPSKLKLVSEINDQLPAPFEAGSDLAIDRVSRVAFRLANERDTGYLELLNAPWNEERLVLGVFGNSPAGVIQASQVLTRGSLRQRLGGNFALVSGEQIFIGGTRLAVSAPATPVPTAAGSTATSPITETVDPAPENSTATAPRSGPPLIAALGGSLLVMLLVVGGFVWWSVYRRRRS